MVGDWAAPLPCEFAPRIVGGLGGASACEFVPRIVGDWVAPLPCALLSSREPVDARSRASHVTVQKAPPALPDGPARSERGGERRGPRRAKGRAGSGAGGEESSAGGGRVCTVAGREGRSPPPPAP
ncbi:hypothetical protein H8959_016676 [Pygathrix nigripes]